MKGERSGSTFPKKSDDRGKRWEFGGLLQSDALPEHRLQLGKERPGWADQRSASPALRVVSSGRQ